MYCAVAFLPDGGTPYGGVRQGYSLFWVSSPRSPSQTGGLPGLPPCKKCQRYGVFPLPPKNTGELVPSTHIIPMNFHHRRPVIIQCGNDPTKVYKLCHRLQGSLVRPEGHRRDCLHLLLPQTLAFPLCPFGTHHHGPMRPFQRPTGYTPITFGAAREGVVSLLQEH